LRLAIANIHCFKQLLALNLFSTGPITELIVIDLDLLLVIMHD